VKSGEIRRSFLDYFAKHGHTIVPSSPLVPPGDPTILFTNAGMVQFKSVFLGQEKRAYRRATSCQKCLRAGGKHNDLENVGRTFRHHTFFEMLGNFSFSDYFKEEAIFYAWNFLINELGLEKERLWITIFKEDQEAFEIWHKKMEVPTSRIVHMGEKDNFWAMGDTGPCGPCSEIVIDLGEEIGCRRPNCSVACDCGRFLEIWNLVFMQYNRDSSGRLTPLPNPCIDTGMGLERITAVMQGKYSNYDTDLFMPIISAIEEISGKRYRTSERLDVSFRVIADHCRAVPFIVADGILPSNEGRGYVLRRILRRAIRYGHFLGIKEPFLYKLLGLVVDIMGDVYPEIRQAERIAREITLHEEERFLETLDFGLKLLFEEIDKGLPIIPGDLAFKLYDTYGFPIDIVTDIAKERGISVDLRGFELAMASQRERSRAARKLLGLKGDLYENLTYKGIKTEFLGYERTEAEAKALYLIKDGKEIERAKANDVLELITDKTPFYGEAGGQVGDRGIIVGPSGKAEVNDTKRLENLIIHFIKVTEGEIGKGEALNLRVDEKRRRAISLNHTATHLLHACLRKVLGSHVRQAGSLVSDDHLRFDFTHFTPLDTETLEEVEALVNEAIRLNRPVEISLLPFNEAVAAGAIAIFEEKYADIVRMVNIPGISKELCGGIHVKRTGDIGIFKIVSEASVASGVRRIEAVTGEAAIRFIQEKERMWHHLAKLLRAKPKEVVFKVEKLIEENKKREREIEKLKALFSKAQSERILKQVRNIKDVKVISTEAVASDAKELRDLGDKLKDRLRSCVIVLGARINEKALITAMVTKDLTDRISAGELIKEIAPLVGGSGGGRREMAQAGGRCPEKLPQALKMVYKIVASMI